MILHPIIQEPDLEFGSDKSICPRQGIAEFGVYDTRLPIRRKEMLVGAVGTPEGLEKFAGWLDRCSGYISPKFNPKDKHLMPNFHYPFYGFNEDSGFRAKLTYGGFVFVGAENNADGRVVVFAFFEVVIHSHIHIHLSDCRVGQLFGFQIYQDKTFEIIIVENQIYEKIRCVGNDVLLSGDKGETFAEFHQKLLQMAD